MFYAKMSNVPTLILCITYQFLQYFSKVSSAKRINIIQLPVEMR